MGGNDLSILKEGCVVYYLNGLRDTSCNYNYDSVWFICEYTNQTIITCPSNLYNDSVFGCGLFLLNFFFIEK